MEANSINNNLLSEQRNKKNTFLSLTSLLIGVALIVLSFSKTIDSQSFVYYLAVTLALIALIVGVIKLFFSAKDKIFTPTKSRVKSMSVNYSLGNYSILKNALETGDFTKVLQLKQSDASEIKMEINISDDNQFASCQIFEWIPYNYEAKSDVYMLKPNAVMGLRLYINQLHK